MSFRLYAVSLMSLICCGCFSAPTAQDYLNPGSGHYDQQGIEVLCDRCGQFGGVSGRQYHSGKILCNRCFKSLDTVAAASDAFNRRRAGYVAPPFERKPEYGHEIFCCRCGHMSLAPAKELSTSAVPDYRFQGHGYYLDAKGFQEHRVDPDKVSFFLPPDKNGGRPNVNVIVQPGLTTREQYLSISLNELQQAGMKVNNRQDLTVSGKDALMLDYEHASGNDGFRFLGLVVVDSNQAVLVTAMAPHELFGEYEKVFRDCLMSLRLGAMPAVASSGIGQDHNPTAVCPFCNVEQNLAEAMGRALQEHQRLRLAAAVQAQQQVANEEFLSGLLNNMNQYRQRDPLPGQHGRMADAFRFGYDPSCHPAPSPKPTTVVPSGNYAGVGSGHWIREKIDGGSLIRLEDSSLWGIASWDRINTRLWLATEDIVVVEGVGGYQLVNTDAKTSAEAKYLGR